MHVYKFRNCLLNTAERSVIKDRQHLELTTKTFDVLQYLIENAGKVVSKDELLGNVWNGNFVEESNLPVHISKLRRSLSETRDCRYIETVQGTGYRFVAPLQVVGDDEWEAASATSVGSLSFAANLGTSLDHSIAVLPLQNECGDPDLEYLADGLTEGIINSLSHIRGFRVIARDTVFRYKERLLNLQEVGEELAVSKIMTGRVRLVGDSLIVAAELINSLDGTQLWGGHYRRPFAEVVDVQQEIVKALTTAIFRREALSPPPTENAESFKYYLMGKYLLGKRTAPDTNKAIELFRRSVKACSTNVHAYAAMVDGYQFLYILDRSSRDETLAKIQPILDRLSTLNQSVDVVQLMHGELKLGLHWDARAAEQFVRRSLILNPNFVAAHSLYAEIMIIFGKSAEARKHAMQILALDPISVPSLKRVGRTFYKLGDYAEAAGYLRDAYEMEPKDFELLLLLGATIAETGDYATALEFLNKSYLSHTNIETLSMIGYVEGLAGRRQNACRVLDRIKCELHNHKSHSLNLARVYSAIGEKETALKLLNDAFDQRSLDLYALEFDPRWKSLRNEEEFEVLLKRLISNAR